MFTVDINTQVVIFHPVDFQTCNKELWLTATAEAATIAERQNLIPRNLYAQVQALIDSHSNWFIKTSASSPEFQRILRYSLNDRPILLKVGTLMTELGKPCLDHLINSEGQMPVSDSHENREALLQLGIETTVSSGGSYACRAIVNANKEASIFSKARITT